MKYNRRRTIALLAAIVMMAGIVSYAGFVVVYQINGNVHETQPPVYFTGGTNNNTIGLDGNAMVASIGPNGTSATVNFSVTYGDTYIVDLLNITNSASTDYYAELCVATPVQSTTGVVSSAEALVVNSTGNVLATLDLLTSGSCTSTFTIPASGNVTVDFYFTLSEGTQLDTSNLTFTITLQYSNENPVPATP